MQNTPTMINVLACGIPGSGKTTFCAWLELRKGFLHLDFDQLLQGRGDPVKLSLVDQLRQNPETFVSELAKRGQPAIIDWGFPIGSLSAVRSLKGLGFTIWWFDGDRVASRHAFANRDTAPLKAFRAQMESIENNWAQIKEVIGDNIIKTVTAGPTHATPEWIHAQMFKDGQ